MTSRRGQRRCRCRWHRCQCAVEAPHSVEHVAKPDQDEPVVKAVYKGARAPSSVTGRKETRHGVELGSECAERDPSPCGASKDVLVLKSVVVIINELE